MKGLLLENLRDIFHGIKEYHKKSGVHVEDGMNYVQRNLEDLEGLWQWIFFHGGIKWKLSQYMPLFRIGLIC